MVDKIYTICVECTGTNAPLDGATAAVGKACHYIKDNPKGGEEAYCGITASGGYRDEEDAITAEDRLTDYVALCIRGDNARKREQ